MQRHALVILTFLLTFVVCACDGGSDPTQGGSTGLDGGSLPIDGGVDASQSFTIGGNVAGLTGSGLALKNGAETLAIGASGAFVFKSAVANGASYAVTIATQPSSPSQTCAVLTGAGTVSNASVSNVAITCTTSKFKVGGTAAGIAGTGLVLQDNNGDDLSVSADGSFAFATPVASGSSFAVTVKSQPTLPTQTCTVTGGAGTMGSGDVTSVSVNCATGVFSIGGQLSGLNGSVTLQDNGGDDLVVTSNGGFAFATPIASGAAYAVTVKTQPGSPVQTCSVTSASGTVGGAAVTSVRVACVTNPYTIGGTVSGLAGSGLVLQDNAGDNLTVAADGSFVFATSIASGASYAVTIFSQPSSPSQTCTLTNATGTVAGANITNVAVACTTNRYTIGGTVSGLVGSGLVLQDNAGDDLTVGTNGTFTFSTSVASGAPYAITVLSQPGSPAQTCSVSGGTGTVGAGNVTSATINCATNTYTIGGTVSGLAGTAVLQDNAGDDLTLSANGAFAFATPIASGQPYAVTVHSQPGAPAQTCVVANGGGNVGAANVTNVTVTCTTNRYAIRGTISGLAAAESVVLQDNGGDNLTVGANGSFAFATHIASGASYAVTVLTNPASPLAQTCVVTNGSGNVAAADVSNVTVTCTTNKYTVGGTVTGLVGTGLVLQDNGGDNRALSSNGTFAFATSVASGSAFAVSLFQNPTLPSQTCVVTNGSGTVTNANITSVTVTCTTNTYSVGGTITGLAAGDGVVLQDNGGSNLVVSASGSFVFATKVASGAAYAVTILSQSGTTAQTCVVSGGSGTIGAANVTGVTINCTTNTYTIGGTISGLAGGSVVLQDNAGDNRTVSSNGSFSFATPIASGATYAVTVLTNPGSPAQTCVVSSGSGTVGGANVTSVSVSCTVNRYTIGGTISGLASGESVVLQDNGADDLTIGANGTFTFATSVPSGSAYLATVLTNPASPIAQTCAITSAGNTVGAANVTDIAVVCTTNVYTIGGTISGLVGTVVLRDNGGDDLSSSAIGPFTFATSVASGSAYAVTVFTQPSGMTCSVASGSGTVGSANVTNVAVSCAVGPIFDSLTGPQNRTTRGAGSSCGTQVVVSASQPISAIAVKNTMSAASNIKFMIWNNSGTLLYISAPKAFTDTTDSWKLSDALSFTLAPGTYNIGGISDTAGTWDFDTTTENVPPISSTSRNPNWSNYASPASAGNGGADCGIRLYN